MQLKMAKLLGRTAFLSLLGALAGLILNGLRPDGVALRAAPPAAVCKAPDAVRPVERLSPEQANSLCADPTVLVADARSSTAFAAGHVAGAVHLPCAAPGGLASEVPRILQNRKTVVVYGDDTEDALAVADGLRRRNSNTSLRVAVIEGGFSAWDQAGFACSSGPCPECSEGRHEHAPGEAVP